MNIYLLNVEELIGGGQEQFELLQGRLDETRRKKALAAKTPKTRAAALGAGLLLQRAVRDWERNRERSRNQDWWRCRDRRGTEEGGGQEQNAVFTEQSPCVWRFAVSDLLSEPVESLPLSYRYGEKGKPYFREIPLFFSISHSGNYVLCAVDEREIGADIQRIQSVDVGKLAGRFFSEPERMLLERCGSDGERKRLFFELWTRKEAWGKLTGEGVAPVLGRDMSAEGEAPSPLEEAKATASGNRKATNTGRSVEWTAFSPPEGYAAAICRFGGD